MIQTLSCDSNTKHAILKEKISNKRRPVTNHVLSKVEKACIFHGQREGPVGMIWASGALGSDGRWPLDTLLNNTEPQRERRVLFQCSLKPRDRR